MLHRMPAQPSRLQATLVHMLFLASGAAGLMFELLWFRLAGLAFGNTVWASTAVLAAFMAGLALGNALAGAGRLTFTRPLRWFAAAEASVALCGIALLWLLPDSGHLVALAPELPGLRMGLAFLLMLVPTTAMGLTLPLVVRALSTQLGYGRLLGRLYGINTLGAVLGVIAAEFWLLGSLGIVGTGLLAGCLNLAAAGVALGLNRDWPAAQESRSSRPYRLTLGASWLLAALLSGATLLALEVVWFRLLLLHVRGTASAFAAMLAIVLAGIAIGGWLASLWLKQHPASRWSASVVVLGCGLGLCLGYRLLPLDTGLAPWWPGLILMAATATGSGLLFTLLAAGYASVIPEPSRATGRILVANTGGGMLGAAVAGLVLLPRLGIEHSLLLLLCCYLLCLLLVLPNFRPGTMAACAGLASLALWLFPFGQMQQHMSAATAAWRAMDQSRVIYQREGLNETVQLLQRELFGEPLAHRVVTNGDSMSGTERDSRRYMKLFAWLPMALHPGLSEVLLISYGLGSTAEALVADPNIRKLTVVDISPEILAASRLTHVNGMQPLEDPRLQLHIEDGRHYLLTTDRRFDLITGEPPPPRLAGIVNLYTREYFVLMHARLNPGGLASYWLPVDQLTLDSSRAILAAFCEVFSDCSLWSGSNYNWIMLGSRNGLSPADLDRVTRLWREPAIARDISALGFEQPAQLGATFIADAGQIKSWIDASPVLSDSYPKRLAESGPDTAAMQQYAKWLDTTACAQRFSASEWIRTVWPTALKAESVAQYELQPVLNNELRPDSEAVLRLVDGVLEFSRLRIPVFWLLGSGVREQKIVDRRLQETGYLPEYAWHLGVRALADRRFEIAAQLFTDSVQFGHDGSLGLAVLSYCRAGLTDAAEKLAGRSAQALPLRCW